MQVQVCLTLPIHFSDQLWKYFAAQFLLFLAGEQCRGTARQQTYTRMHVGWLSWYFQLFVWCHVHHHPESFAADHCQQRWSPETFFRHWRVIQKVLATNTMVLVRNTLQSPPTKWKDSFVSGFVLSTFWCIFCNFFCQPLFQAPLSTCLLVGPTGLWVSSWIFDNTKACLGKQICPQQIVSC